MFSNASLRGDFSKGMQNKVFDSLMIPAANTSYCCSPVQITIVNIHYRAPSPKLWAKQARAAGCASFDKQVHKHVFRTLQVCKRKITFPFMELIFGG